MKIWHLLLVPLVAIVAVFLYGLFLIVLSFIQTKSQPREAMSMCQKHGPIRTSHMITFAGVVYCPICFHSNLKEAEKTWTRIEEVKK